MVTNIDQTVYLHLSDKRMTNPITLPDNQPIYHAENEEHLYLAMWVIASDDTSKRIECNFKQRAFSITKFYEWLAVNEFTPINIKLQVLDACMFAAYLYGCECW